ncbi:4Fe-4S binding protein [Pelotomaculum isophthalicicum JI]|uniref:4Fe-4S binding protein n=1 Tax=Pelotomaculum isophthalicicum JI TaxID=947010 RepID=A0A9X4H4H1_9FIRM|nr:mercury methylation ferredoxin HgcB [Pelotomaculum isophthalicicum]MDF9408748.1 4Fe-4S binding protein [Pelotomaculum isophthalicicum JI]
MKNRYLKNVSTLKMNSDRCTGCGMCIEVCPHKVFDLKNGRSEIVDKDACMECGACAKNCPFNAIEVNPGVGCAQAIIKGWLTGTEPSCDCSGGSSNSGCC